METLTGGNYCLQSGGRNEKLIQIQALAKDFTSEQGAVVSALAPCTLNIAEHEFVCVVGPSGCGKSTLLRIVSGLESATAGLALYKNEPIYRPGKDIGMVFQQYSLLPWRTVAYNITLGLEAAGLPKNVRDKAAREYLSLIKMEPFASAYPYELSGGMQQRVAIARALANDPQVLLMDEPFGALDAHTRILMQRELLRIWEQNKKTIIFVTHSVDEAVFLADRIVVMSAHPGTIRKIIDVDMPRPRSRSNPKYGCMADEILTMLDC